MAITVTVVINGGRNSSVGSVLGSLSCVMQRRGNILLASGRGDFSLGDSMGSDSIPPKTLSDESINRSLVCAHMHFILQSQKILTFMSCKTRGNADNKNTPCMHHPRRRNMTTPLVRFKNKQTVTYTKISPKMVNSRYISGKAEKKRKKKAMTVTVSIKGY